MSVAAPARPLVQKAPAQARPGAPAPAPAAAPPQKGDAWPRTRRPLPWLLAGFLTMVWLIPFDSIRLGPALPIDGKLDRYALLGLTLAWLLSIAIGGPAGPRARRSAVGPALLLFVGIALVSVVLNVAVLAHLQEANLAVKKLSLVCAFVVFFYIVATSLRSSELRGFSMLVVILGTITAIGTIYEYRTGHNLFFDYATRALSSFASIHAEPSDQQYLRPQIVGPTRQGLANATLLAIALPFALVSLLGSDSRRRRLLHAVAAAIILAGAVATLKKTAVIAPLAGIAVLFAYRPRSTLRLLPLGIALLVAIKVLVPGAAPGILFQFSSNTGTATTHDRQIDYAAVLPDVLHHPALGRGFGTFDPYVYRFLDNQYLMLLVETGLIGLAAYLLVIAVSLRTAHRAIRARDRLRSAPALAALAAITSYAVANQLYDAFSFPQGAYAFFFLAGLVVVAAHAAPPVLGPHPAVALPQMPAPADPLRLAVVVSFLDEEAHLPRLLTSIDAQDLLPSRLVLVDDGSTDGSAAIAEAFASGRSYVTVLRRSRRPAESDRLGSAAELRSFAWAAAQIREPYDVLAKLDADLELTAGTFAELATRLQAEPRLGIAGAYLSVPHPDGCPQRERHPARHVRGATKFYRRECYEEIAPLPACLGWDTIDEATARMNGWTTASFEISTGDPLHLRPTGAQDGGARALRRWGRCAYGYGAGPLHVALAAASRSCPPHLLGGLHYLVGWMLAAVSGAPRATAEVRAHLRREQRADLRSRITRRRG